VAYCFKRKESVSKAIKRLGAERIEHALGSLKTDGHAEAIHRLRKEIKKVRAMLRLVRPRLKARKYRRMAKLLREAANRLATPRDAYIRTKTLRNIVRHFKGPLPRALRRLRMELRSGLAAELRRFRKGKNVKAIHRTLHRVSKEVKDLDIKGKEWNALGPGIQRAYGGGRRAYRIVLNGPSPRNLHEWRKRAKDLWYQVSLLRPAWRPKMVELATQLEALSDYLGDDHDLVVLEQSAKEGHRHDGNAGELKAFCELIAQRHREWRAAALAIGERLYAEKTSTFCNRLAEYWKTWRREKDPSTR
jgi:CHAD domain-containing protein